MKVKYRIVELYHTDKIKYRVDKLDKIFGIPIGWDKNILFTFNLKSESKTTFDHFPLLFDKFSEAETWIFRQAKPTRKPEIKCNEKIIKEIEIQQ
jgi:hypothetical protein